jgi:hypothetical protein
MTVTIKARHYSPIKGKITSRTDDSLIVRLSEMVVANLTFLLPAGVSIRLEIDRILNWEELKQKI